MERDALGRRRQPLQNRGLRPLFPKLPANYQSRLLRVAMSAMSWAHLDERTSRSSARTKPRALGELIEGWLARDRIASHPLTGVAPHGTAAMADWQDWQMRKELALLSRSGSRAPTALM